MRLNKKSFSGIRWKLTITYMLATLLMLFVVEVLITVTSNRYAFTSINFIYSSAQMLDPSNYALVDAMIEPVDMDYIDRWIDTRKETFLRVPDRLNDRKDPSQADNLQNTVPLDKNESIIDLTPKTVAYSESKSTLTIVNSEGIVLSTNNTSIFPVGESVYGSLTDDEISMLDVSANTLIPAPQYSILNQDVTSLILPVRRAGVYYGAVIAQYYAPTFWEQVKAAVAGFLPELPVFLLISATIGILFGFIIANSFTKRLDHMGKTTLQWGQGDFTKKAEVHGNDEISTLAVSLNHMADQRIQDQSAAPDQQ